MEREVRLHGFVSLRAGQFLDKADVIFVSKEFALMQGYTNKEDAARGFGQRSRHGFA